MEVLVNVKLFPARHWAGPGLKPAAGFGLVITLTVLFHVVGYSQFLSAEIGVDGLTCSQCQRSVEMGLRKLDFIDDVQVNLDHTDGKIIFKSDKKINLNT